MTSVWLVVVLCCLLVQGMPAHAAAPSWCTFSVEGVLDLHDLFGSNANAREHSIMPALLQFATKYPDSIDGLYPPASDGQHTCTWSPTSPSRSCLWLDVSSRERPYATPIYMRVCVVL